MKKVVIACMLLTCVLLSSCTKMKKDTSTYYTREHIEPKNTQSTVVNGIDSYEKLREAVEDVISKVQTDVSLVVVNYEGELQTDLDILAHYITDVYPLGTYGVSSVIFKANFIASYCEVETKIVYSRPYDEIRGVTRVMSIDEMDEVLCTMIKSRDLHRAFIFNGFNIQPDVIESYFAKAWLESSYYAYGIKDVDFTWYPSAESQSCIVDVNINLTDDILEVEDTVKKTMSAADMIASDCASVKNEEKVRFVLSWLQRNVYYDKNASDAFSDLRGDMPKTAHYTASGALLNGSAAQSGITLATSALLSELDVKNQVVIGKRNGSSYMWLYITYAGEKVFLDPCDIYSMPFDSCMVNIDAVDIEYSWDQKMYNLK